MSEEKFWSKKEIFEKLLSSYHVKVGFLYAHKDAIIPEFLKVKDKHGNNLVMFDYSYNFPVPIPDLTTTDEGISATLSIKRTNYYTFVPWDSIVVYFTEDLNIQFATDFKDPKIPDPPKKEDPPKRSPPKLRSV